MILRDGSEEFSVLPARASQVYFCASSRALRESLPRRLNRRKSRLLAIVISRCALQEG